MPLLWESNEIYFVAGFSVFVTLGVVVSLIYFAYKRSISNGRRENEEQAALEKVLLRKESVATSSGPPTKPLIVNPSFSSPNKLPARHLRSGSYSPNHFLSPYHNRQPRRNSSPTSPSKISAEINSSLVHQQDGNLNKVREENETELSLKIGENELIKTTRNSKLEKMNKNVSQPQYYGTIPTHRSTIGKFSQVAPCESNTIAKKIICATNNSTFAANKWEYAKLPGTDKEGKVTEEKGEKESCRMTKSLPKLNENCNKIENSYKQCHFINEEEGLRRKLVLQQQFEKGQKQIMQPRKKQTLSEDEFKKNKIICEEEDIPYYISTQ